MTDKKDFEPNGALVNVSHREGWSAHDQAQLNFLQRKYGDREKLGDAWVEKRKHAAMNEKIDGKPNPHYPRLAMEAELARMAYDMAYVLEQNSMMQEQINILTELYHRVGLLEGAYAHLSQSTDYVKNQYKDSMRKHHEERREYQTRTAMHRAGLSPDSEEDRLKWAHQLEAITANFFKITQSEEQDNGSTVRTKS